MNENDTWTSRAPGRLDVMGGIADYSGALVLQLPLDRATTVSLRRTASPHCDITSGRGDERAHFRIALSNILDGGALSDPRVLAEWFAGLEADRWAAYIVGVVQYCLKDANRGEALLPGLELVVESTVPEGKGVSSSAALEVATMMAVDASYGVARTPEETAAACQWVENHIVGAPCGIMDQMTSACGKRDRLLRLRCQPGTIEGHIAVAPGFRFYGIDSGVRHAVTGADYGTVRAAAFMGYRMIADLAGLPVEHDGGRVAVNDLQWGGYLANITPAEFERRFAECLPEQMRGEDFLERFHGTTDRVTRVEPDRTYPVRDATAHPIYEQERVDRFAELLADLGTKPDVPLRLGALMYCSHGSYSACGLGSEATDRLVEMVAETDPALGVYGAKITGGGSGGTVAILGTVGAEPVVREIAKRYSEETGRAAEVFAESGPGAAEAGVTLTR
jgi:L-arabinokinase